MGEWFSEFLKIYLSGNRDSAYRLKHDNIPQKLYRFEPYSEERVSLLLSNKLWFTVPKDFNDPFDSRGIYWDQDLENSLESIISNNKFNQYSSVADYIEGGISSLCDNVRACCFSEELFSMPMWAHYSKNHRGFCVEYNFRNLNYDDELTKCLFPIGYAVNRYNVTDLLKRLLAGSFDGKTRLLFFLMNVKHESWSYEKEWRIINAKNPNQKIFSSGSENCPIKPTAIYLGMNFNDIEIPSFINKFKDQGILFYKLKRGNSKFFELDLQKLDS